MHYKYVCRGLEEMFEFAHLHKRGSQLAESLFCGDAHRCKAAVCHLCLGALPLLYPAAPPSVFDYAIVKYTAPAVALVREYVVILEKSSLPPEPSQSASPHLQKYDYLCPRIN